MAAALYNAKVTMTANQWEQNEEVWIIRISIQQQHSLGHSSNTSTLYSNVGDGRQPTIVVVDEFSLDCSSIVGHLDEL
jgi:hypothetical protein